MTRARSQLVLGQPFFGALALGLTLREDAGCHGMWTDGVSLGYNPRAVAALPDAQVLGMQAHEVMHLACKHHLRRNGRDKELWNRACDLAVNAILVEAGFSLPKDFPQDPRYKDMAAEDIYVALAAVQHSKGGAENTSGQEQDVDQADAPGGAQPLGDGQEVPARPEGVTPGDKREPGEQRGTPGKGREADPHSPLGDPSQLGEVRDHPGLDGSDSGPEVSRDSSLQELERQVDINVSRAARQAQGMGALPGSVARLVRFQPPPELDWRALLRRFVVRASSNDYSWSPPSRRHVHMGLHLPSPRCETLSDMVVAVDCSGYVDQASLDAFCAELSAVLEAYDTRLTAIFCDCAVRDARQLTRLDLPLRLEVDSGGGTDYRPVFQHVQDLCILPACLVYLTDLECGLFGPEPTYPVLWAARGPRKEPPPFGELIRLE